MTLDETFWRMAVALGLGLLVGMQRERASTRLAGLRTFALFSLLGFLCGTLGGWIPAAGFVAVAAVLVTGNLIEHQTSGIDPGVTTEAAALSIFAVGVHLASGSVAVSTAFGVVVAALLALKSNSTTNRLDRADFKASVSWRCSLVILPVSRIEPTVRTTSSIPAMSGGWFC